MLRHFLLLKSRFVFGKKTITHFKSILQQVFLTFLLIENQFYRQANKHAVLACKKIFNNLHFWDRFLVLLRRLPFFP